MKKKNSTKAFIIGALLLPALLSGCSEPGALNEPNKPNEKKALNGDEIGVVVENVTIDGVPVSMDELRAVGRTDIVKYTGDLNGEDLIQLKWTGVRRGKKLPVQIHAKPDLYLKDFKFRYRPKENEAYQNIPLNLTTYNSKDPLKNLSGDKPIQLSTLPVPEDDNNVYVTLDYGRVGNGGDYGVIASFQFDNVPVKYAVTDGHYGFHKEAQYVVRPISVVIENLNTHPLIIDFIELKVSLAPQATGYLMSYKKRSPESLSEWERFRQLVGGGTVTLRSDEKITLNTKGKRTIQFWVDFSRSIGRWGEPAVYALKKDEILRNVHILSFADGQTNLASYPWAKCVIDFPQKTFLDPTPPEPPFVTRIENIHFWKNDNNDVALLNYGGVLLNLSSTVTSENGREERTFRLLPPNAAGLGDHLGIFWLD